ncbi:MAG TPA: M23 family metallopeptidase [Longimicrobium sp.]|nr:M23 family metallopeptidase [Longimicrobium sp.]
MFRGPQFPLFSCRKECLMKPKFQMPFMCHQKWRASIPLSSLTVPSNTIILDLVTGAKVEIPVFASFGGTVAAAGNLAGGGEVTLKHADGFVTEYGNLNTMIVQMGQQVVRGQKLGSVGNTTTTPRLRYSQKDSTANAIPVEFDGQAIAVHLGAKKPDGTFPTQELVSKNCPIGITEKVVTGGATATCTEGAGLRATATCENTYTKIEINVHGPWVGAKATSKAKFPPGSVAVENGHEIS